MAAEVVLEVADLRKTFHLGFLRKRVEAVRGVSFEVRRGEIFGFIGPNGAGKTTSIKMMLQLIFPTHGQVKLFGASTFDPDARRRLGYLPENPYIYTYLKPLEFLDLCGQLTSMPKALRRRRAEALVHKLGIAHALDRPIGRFSKGMTQRLGFCQALLHEPELLILDEPFSGLDPIGRKDIRDLLLEQKAAGKTLLLTSHVLSDVEMLSERVAIVRQGKIVAYGALNELLRPEVRRVEVALSHVSGELRAKLDKAAQQVRDLDEQITLAVVEGDEGVPELLKLSLDAGARVLAVTPHRETLEDLFVRKAVAESTSFEP
ncbi:MAG TPA: ABC transporter ATP-binding protein [Polyangiales bacterium]|jgi:ABC-2 type transport system ATP-binding protein|nr:ABC transporter ATP-binding protein [Polyangiales bacterium]